MFSVLLMAACGDSAPPAIDETDPGGESSGKGGAGSGGGGAQGGGCALGGAECTTGGKGGTGAGGSGVFGQGGGGPVAGGDGHDHAGQAGAVAVNPAGGSAGVAGSGVSGGGQGGVSEGGQGGSGPAGGGPAGSGPAGSGPAGSTQAGSGGTCGPPSPGGEGGAAGAAGMGACVLATLSPEDKADHVILSEGNLVATTSAVSLYDAVRATEGHDHGKWYWEATYTKAGDQSPGGLGFGSSSVWLETGPGEEGCELGSDGYATCDGKFAIGDGFAEGDTVGLAYDLDQGLFYVHLASGWLNGADPATGGGIPFLKPIGYLEYPTVTVAKGDEYRANFGQQPTVYPVPAGYESTWCRSDTLPSPPVPPGSAECDMKNGEMTSYTYLTGVNEEVILLGMYDPDPLETMGPVKVTVHTNSRPLSLVLSSYSPVNWQISLDPGASISSIYLTSFKGDNKPDSTVTGGGVAPVMVPWGGLAYKVPSPEATVLLDYLGKMGIHPTAAFGCYGARSYVVGDSGPPCSP